MTGIPNPGATTAFRAVALHLKWALPGRAQSLGRNLLDVCSLTSPGSAGRASGAAFPDEASCPDAERRKFAGTT